MAAGTATMASFTFGNSTEHRLSSVGSLNANEAKAIDALFDLVTHEKLKIADLFNKIDADRNGTLDSEEIAYVLRSLGVNMSQQEHRRIMNVLDDDGNGIVVIAEFFERMNDLKLRLQKDRADQRLLDISAARSQRHRDRQEDLRNSATAAFFTVLRAQGGIGNFNWRMVYPVQVNT